MVIWDCVFVILIMIIGPLAVCWWCAMLYFDFKKQARVLEEVLNGGCSNLRDSNHVNNNNVDEQNELS